MHKKGIFVKFPNTTSDYIFLQVIENIKEKLTLLNDLDVKIKTGRIDQAIGLELFLLD